MARSIDPLVVGRVVGDVVDLFVPTVDFKVRYASRQVTNGCEIKPSDAVDRPLVQINAPPSSTEVVLDIPQGMDASKGLEVVEYMGPRPPTGIHRYVFSLFKQPKPSGSPSNLQWPDHADVTSCRVNFSTRRFASANNLGLPVATVYFNSQKETARKLR
ncbi:hypothetical protein V2J09_010077 [Rumex salicifolius]